MEMSVYVTAGALQRPLLPSPRLSPNPFLHRKRPQGNGTRPLTSACHCKWCAGSHGLSRNFGRRVKFQSAKKSAAWNMNVGHIKRICSDFNPHCRGTYTVSARLDIGTTHDDWIRIFTTRKGAQLFKCKLICLGTFFAV